MDEHQARIIWAEAQDLAADLSQAGTDQALAAAAVATFLDAIVPLDVLVPGPAGLALEAVDGAAFQRVVLALLNAFQPDPARKEARLLRRVERRAARVARRSIRGAHE